VRKCLSSKAVSACALHCSAPALTNDEPSTLPQLPTPSHLFVPEANPYEIIRSLCLRHTKMEAKPARQPEVARQSEAVLARITDYVQNIMEQSEIVRLHYRC
jgi:hypothetical protein